MESSSESYCLLITHELTRTGAPIALVDVARVLIKHGHYVIVCSPFDGPLREEFEYLGCEVLIYKETMDVLTDPHYFVETRALLPLASRADIVFVNTIALYRLIKLFNDLKFPVLWWIHEGYLFSHPLVGLLPSKVGDNVSILHSSTTNKNLLPRLGTEAPEDTMLMFGVEDTPKKTVPYKQDEPFIFICAGSICKKKGQDTLVEAVALMKQNTDIPFEVRLAGSPNEEEVFEQVQTAIEEGLPIRNLGLLSREEILSNYAQSHCVVVPSRADSGPIVAVEAMMLSLPCICSDPCGVASFIETNVNGVLIPSEDPQALAQAMTDMMSMSESSRADMGAQGRKTYLDHYSMSAFEDTLLTVVDKKMVPAKPLKQVEDSWDALELQLKNKQEELENKQAELESKQAEIERLEFAIKDIESSKSYRMMEPVRALNRKMHGQ